MHHPFLSIVTPASILLPIAAGLAKYHPAAPREILAIFYFLVATAVISLIATLLIIYHKTNTALIHADTIIESLFLLRFFYLAFPRPTPSSGSTTSPRPRIRKWILGLAILFPMFCCVNLVFLQHLDRHNTYTRPLEALIVIALSLYYWGTAGSGEITERWTNSPVNWIISGLLLYFSSAFFLFVFSSYLATNYSLAVNLLVWNIHAGLTILMYILFTIGFVKCKR